MPGTITKINVKAGDEVHKGEILAETDARIKVAAQETQHKSFRPKGNWRCLSGGYDTLCCFDF